MKRKLACHFICCLLFMLLLSTNVFAEVLPIEQSKVGNNTFVTTVIVPIAASLLGAILSGFIGWLIGRKQFKKELVVDILPERCSFIVYNTGNANVNAKEILLYQKHWFKDIIIYSVQITDNINISNNADPVLFTYDEDKFFVACNNWAHETENMKLGNNVYCKLIDVKGKCYKSKSKYLSENIEKYQYDYWFPDFYNEAPESECPF